jgi:hypothetical protein
VGILRPKLFPYPPRIDRNCVKIIRSEGEDLLQMTSNFLLKYGSAIGNNDVILIGSANQLLKEGLTGYVSSILDTMDRLCVGPRFGCTILPAPFILLGGCDDPQLVRSIMDFHAWIRLSGVDRGGILSDALAAVERHILSSGKATHSWTSISYKIPLNLPSKKKLHLQSRIHKSACRCGSGTGGCRKINYTCTYKRYQTLLPGNKY